LSLIFSRLRGPPPVARECVVLFCVAPRLSVSIAPNHAQLIVSSRFMTAADLAEYLQVSRTTVYKLMKREKGRGFPAVKLGREWLVDLEQVQNWMVQVIEHRKKRKVRGNHR
jgi:excisionase family DNA binding protein